MTEHNRDSETGEYASDAYTAEHPDTTTTEHDGPPHCRAANERGARCAFDRNHVGDHATSLGNSFASSAG